MQNFPKTVRPVCDICKCFYFFMPSRAICYLEQREKIMKTIGIEKNININLMAARGKRR